MSNASTNPEPETGPSLRTYGNRLLQTVPSTRQLLDVARQERRAAGPSLQVPGSAPAEPARRRCPSTAQALPVSTRLTSTHENQRREQSEPFRANLTCVGVQSRVSPEDFANAARRVRIPPGARITGSLVKKSSQQCFGRAGVATPKANQRCHYFTA